MAWQVVAEGASFSELSNIVGDMNLPKGTKVRVVMDLKVPVGWAFDVWGAELLFKPFVPDGLDMVDVYGEGSQGIVEMEADPAWLLGMLAFIKANWIALIIAGFVLGAIILFIRVAIELPAAVGIPIFLVVGVIAAVIGFSVVSKYIKPEAQRSGGET